MKKVLVFCLLLALGLSLGGSSVWAIDVGWMQKGVRVWYFGGVGSSDAEEAYLFSAVNGNDAQVTKHSGMNHWGTTFAINTTTYSFLDKGPCWIHPQVLQTIDMGDTWMGFEITFVTRAPYTYDTLPYRLLPAKALFDLTPQREVVKLTYMIAGFSTGNAYFDAETGLCLLYSQLSGSVTVFFILSEINYDFANHVAFSEDDGPHTGFKSFVSELSLGWPSGEGGGTVTIHSSVESRYGNTVEMWVITSECGDSCSSPPYEYYCFFGGIPVLRRINMDPSPQDPPELWNEYGHYLWWWVPEEVLQNSTINVFGVPMTRISTDPYIFEATEEPVDRFFFSKLWFGNDGYMTEFSAKDSATGLDIDPGQTVYFQNLTTVDGLDYYRETMGRATPVPNYGDVDGDLDVDLADAILSMKILAGVPLSQNIGGDADVNGNGRIGIEEATYIMQKAAGLRQD